MVGVAEEWAESGVVGGAAGGVPGEEWAGLSSGRDSGGGRG